MAVHEETIVSYKVFKTLEPIIILTRFIGVCPITYRPQGSGFLIRKSTIFSIYSYILGFSLAIMTAFGIIQDMNVGPEESFRMDSPTEKYITCVDLGVIIFIVLITIIWAHRKLQYLTAIFDRIYKVDQYVPTRLTDKDRKIFIFLIIIVMVPFIILASSDIALWILDNNIGPDTTSKFLKKFISFYILYTMLIGQEFYIWVLMDLIRKRFKNFGHILESKFTIIRRLSVDHTTKTVFSNPKVVKNMLTVEEVLDITRTHEFLCEAIDNLEYYCGFPILTIAASCLLHLIITPYFLLLQIREVGNPANITVQTSWLFTHMARLFFLVEPCHSSMEENQKNLNLIFKILTFDLDKSVRKQLILLTHQISQRNASFSACGLFNIDRSILTTVAGAVTTYLVILFQFMGK